MGRPWELVSQTSETESVAISLLKHLNGDPLDTARTCLGPMLRHEVLVDMVPRPPSHTDGTGALVGTHAKVLLRAGAEGLLGSNSHFPCNTEAHFVPTQHRLNHPCNTVFGHGCYTRQFIEEEPPVLHGGYQTPVLHGVTKHPCNTGLPNTVLLGRLRWHCVSGALVFLILLFGFTQGLYYV